MRRIQATTIAGVALLAGIAAIVSFRHMHELCLRHGEDSLAAVLIPLAVDGTIVVASMSILLANRYGSRGGTLAWTLLITGSLASLGANVAVAEPSLIGRIIAAWPSAALIGSYELLMSQVRRIAAQQPSEAFGTTPHVEQDPAESVADRSPTNTVRPDNPPRPRDDEIVDLHRAAWRWAQVNRHPDGALPSGKAIAEQFERSARWGRWIKNAGLAGELS
ncbi:DUF2637 domain-containing protein [Planomonospora parontospora]|uniref:DUF2637 domain-containing protein n=1 Tax=Planomonospora parontospora TaxID=58119 RepID=UPI001E4664CC|nr:DUF2637 domain-containing protein [Planomonospora parontospora]